MESKKRYNLVVNEKDVKDVLKIFDVFNLGLLGGMTISNCGLNDKFNIHVKLTDNQWNYIKNIISRKNLHLERA